MKRLICIFFAFMLMSGCTQNSGGFSVSKASLNTAFHSKIHGNEFKGTVYFDEKNSMNMTLTYPDYISGYTLCFDGENIISSVNDVENIHKNKDFPDDFSFLSIYKALKKAVTDGVFSKKTDNEYEMTYAGVTVKADEQGNITSAGVDDGYIIFGM